jgi:hypothetical protein
MRTITLFALALTLASCTNDTTSAPKSAVVQAHEKEATEEKSVQAITFRLMTEKETQLPPSYEKKGTIQLIKGFEDKNGKNFLVLSLSEEKQGDEEDMRSQVLLAEHLVESSNGTLKTIRKFQDFVKDCMFDISLSFNEATVSVTDLDNNGFGEATFGYLVDCVSDVSPNNAKLILTENGEKFIIRGTAAVDYGNGKLEGGTSTLGGEMKLAPTEFKAHMVNLWDKEFALK